jgi:hypothetical protein
MIIMMGGGPELWGFIPGFLDDDDPRGAKEQFNERYVSGWQPFEGFTFDQQTGVLQYPGDPPMKPLSGMIFRGQEMILLFDSGWVMVLQLEQNEKGEMPWEICRMD